MIRWMTAFLLCVASTAAAEEPRNAWYWSSPVNIHWDNHGRLLGQGKSAEELAALFQGLKVDMIQISAFSGNATYPSKVAYASPETEKFDTMATWRQVAKRLDVKFGVYVNVIDAPRLADQNPHWRRVDAAGTKTKVCNRPSVDGKGYLEGMLIPMVQEIIARYKPDGLWFDGDWQIPPVCYCDNCRAAWQRATGKPEPPRKSDDPDWPRWCYLEQQRLEEYKQKLADAIHAADPRCMYTSNWSWATSHRDPHTAPEFADTLSGDVGAGTSQSALYACRFAALIYSAQEHTPHDVMSAIYPKPIRSLPRMLQEGALVMASGSTWFLWVNNLTPDQFDHLRACYQLVDARRAVLGRTASANQTAVLLSETSWERSLPDPKAFDHVTPRNVAFALQDARLGVDAINEQTLRERLANYRLVVVANQRHVEPATAATLDRFVADGGTLLVLGNGLLAGDSDTPAVAKLLGLRRKNLEGKQSNALAIGDTSVTVREEWRVEADKAEVLARFARGDALALTRHDLGKGHVYYLAVGQFTYPDEDGLANWLLGKMGCGPLVQVSGPAAERHLVCSLRDRQPGQTILHLADLTTHQDGKRVEPNSTHAIDPVGRIAEVSLSLAIAKSPQRVSVVPAGTTVDWQYADGRLQMRLKNVEHHAAVILEGVDSTAVTLLRPDALPRPVRYELSPVLLEEDFQRAALGKLPAKPIWTANADAHTAIRVAVDPEDKQNRVLEFVDSPQARAGFVPYAVIAPRRLDRGRARLSCDLRLEQGALVNIAARDEQAGARSTAFSVRIDERGRVLAGGKALTNVPVGKWFHLEIEFALGVNAALYDVLVRLPGQEPQRFAGLKYPPGDFVRCTWLGITSDAKAAIKFQLDNIRLERLP